MTAALVCDNCAYLLRVREAFHHTVKVPFAQPLWEARHDLDERLEASLQQLVDSCVIVVVVSDAHQAVDVVPDACTEVLCIYARVFLSDPEKDSNIRVTRLGRADDADACSSAKLTCNK